MNFDITVKGIKVNDRFCWICGHTKDITNHHTIPKHLNPKRNVEVPICQKCHDDLNNEDWGSMKAFAWKIGKVLKNVSENVTTLISRVDNKKSREERMFINDMIKIKEKR